MLRWNLGFGRPKIPEGTGPSPGIGVIWNLRFRPRLPKTAEVLEELPGWHGPACLCRLSECVRSANVKTDHVIVFIERSGQGPRAIIYSAQGRSRRDPGAQIASYLGVGDQREALRRLGFDALTDQPEGSDNPPGS